MKEEDWSFKRLSLFKIEGVEDGDGSEVDSIDLKGIPFIGETGLALSDSSSNDINDVVIIELSLFVRFVSLEPVGVGDHHVCVGFSLPHVDQGKR